MRARIVRMQRGGGLMVTIIASVSRNGVIGKDGRQPLYLKGDLARFKQLTVGNAVVMGRKTFEAVLQKLGKPLPQRDNFVITSQKNYSAAGCVVCNSLQDALKKAEESGKQVFVIGGGQIFQQAIALADRLELTEIDADLLGDVFFPKINASQWREVSRVGKEEQGVKYAFVTYARK